MACSSGSVSAYAPCILYSLCYRALYGSELLMAGQSVMYNGYVLIADVTVYVPNMQDSSESDVGMGFTFTAPAIDDLKERFIYALIQLR
jgi:hypothetical protein